MSARPTSVVMVNDGGAIVGEGDDSIRTYETKIMNGWELTCRIVKQQKLKDITAVILDYVCDGTDMDPQTLKFRELIIKEQDGIRIYPDGKNISIALQLTPTCCRCTHRKPTIAPLIAA